MTLWKVCSCSLKHCFPIAFICFCCVEADKEPVTPKQPDGSPSGGNSRVTSSRFSSTTGLPTRQFHSSLSTPHMVNKRGGNRRSSITTTTTKKLKSYSALKSPGRNGSVESKRGLLVKRNGIIASKEEEGRGEESCDEVDEGKQ